VVASDRALWLAEKAFKEKDRDTIIRELSKLDGYPLDEGLIRFTDRYATLIHSAKRKVGSVDSRRKPRADELIVVFGNYPYSFASLVVNNPIKRNLLEFWSFPVDDIEFEQCWTSVDQIFVLNREDRLDRWYSTLRELARMGAPLNRVTRFPAIIDRSTTNRELNGHIGCMRSHLSILQTVRAKTLRNVMVLEDDFGFSDDIETNQASLELFFKRNYDYDLCLLATSKYGPVLPKDDLVMLSRQPCTSNSGYIVSQSGAAKLIDCFNAALGDLLTTGDAITYAADRCWSALQQGDRFLVFKRRLGFQLPNFSDITGKVAAPFD
jgi:hypothetical protein